MAKTISLRERAFKALEIKRREKIKAQDDAIMVMLQALDIVPNPRRKGAIKKVVVKDRLYVYVEEIVFIHDTYRWYDEDSNTYKNHDQLIAARVCNVEGCLRSIRNGQVGQIEGPHSLVDLYKDKMDTADCGRHSDLYIHIPDEWDDDLEDLPF